MLKKESKLLSTVFCLPVMRDFLEDLVDDKTLRQEAKKHANEVIRAIDRYSKYMMRDNDQETGEQAIDLELWFRQTLKQLEND
tara:strand:+ start:128 stop:376 length:249 start_codon:yes stop_codon:yes gene_type:complete